MRSIYFNTTRSQSLATDRQSSSLTSPLDAMDRKENNKEGKSCTGFSPFDQPEVRSYRQGLVESRIARQFGFSLVRCIIYNTNRKLSQDTELFILKKSTTKQTKLCCMCAKSLSISFFLVVVHLDKKTVARSCPVRAYPK